MARTGEDAAMADETWFAVRTLVANHEDQPWGPHDLEPGLIDHEERTTLWRAPDIDAAIVMAEQAATRRAGLAERNRSPTTTLWTQTPNQPALPPRLSLAFK